MTRLFFLLLIFMVGMFGQSGPAEPLTTLPIGLAVFASFNQLGSPRFTGGVAAIYPMVGSVGVYGTTTTEIYPKKATDPSTGRGFYAVSASVRQGAHKSLLATGRWTFLVGGDVGPGFTQDEPSGIAVSLSSSFVATAHYQINSMFGAVVPVRMLYISGIGWNPVLQAGVVINLKNLPKPVK